MGNPGSASPSAARTLSPFEVDQLAATALALPESWVVVIQPPYGQLAILPRYGRRRFHRCWVADGAGRRVFRDRGNAA